MDRDLWTFVLRAVRRAASEVGWHGGQRRPVYANGLIAAMYIWSVWHDRPLCWACDRAHYGGPFRPPRRLPSVSQFTRRVRSDDCRRILQRVHDAFAQRAARSAAGSVAATSCTRSSTTVAGSSSGA